jgi:hypothetical protein
VGVDVSGLGDGWEDEVLGGSVPRVKPERNCFTCVHSAPRSRNGLPCVAIAGRRDEDPVVVYVRAYLHASGAMKNRGVPENRSVSCPVWTRKGPIAG